MAGRLVRHRAVRVYDVEVADASRLRRFFGGPDEPDGALDEQDAFPVLGSRPGDAVGEAGPAPVDETVRHAGIALA